MIEQLPIIITVGDELAITLPKLNAVKNRLEAQFNFQTMTANWYGDEASAVFIDLQLHIPKKFNDLHAQYEKNSDFTLFSDDVFSVAVEQKKQLTCIVAITTNELALLGAKEKLLAPYVEKKLHKVLNLIAVQLQLVSLTPLSVN